MDTLSLLGVLLAIGAVLVGQNLEGGVAASLLNGPALLIVLGGTLGAIMLQTPGKVFRRALSILPWVISPPRFARVEAIKKITQWSQVARRQGLLGLEDELSRETDNFAHKGLQLLVDGREPAAIRANLEVDIDTKERSDLAAAKIYESMGGYAPTIGIIGAVMGLIHVMENLSEPGLLGSGIATAFVATIYGVGFANLFLLPVANKLKAIVEREARYREMLMEGILSIAEGENPRNIEVKMQGFID